MFVVNWLFARKVEYVGKKPLSFLYQKIITDTNRFHINESWTYKEINGLHGRPE